MNAARVEGSIIELFGRAQPSTLAKSVNGVGKIVAVLPQSQEVVIDHEEIKGFMDAMTMGYKLASPAQLQGLKPGDVVTSPSIPANG